jgi:pantothenate kinase
LSDPSFDPPLADLVERAGSLLAGAPAPGGRELGGRRALLGLTGPPGAGKTTLAAALADAIGPTAAVVGMDGFHLANAELARLGRQDRKGAPDTFDAGGYAALLHRLRASPDEAQYAPAYDRSLEEAVAAAVPVSPDIRLVITEGNYLLLDRPPWDRIRPLLDQVWYRQLDEEVRTDRLLRRHVHFGKSEADAGQFVYGSDAANALLVEATRPLADLVVVGSEPRPPPVGRG